MFIGSNGCTSHQSPAIGVDQVKHITVGPLRHRTAPLYDEEPTLLAVDCEMCATDSDDKALLSLCVVDVDGNIVLQVLSAAVCWLSGH